MNYKKFSSQLYDQDSFYKMFIKDIDRAEDRVIIESPFMTVRRVNQLIPILLAARNRGVKIVINTKPINEHNPVLSAQVEKSIAELQALNIVVLVTVGHHRKLAIIDNEILWEGSLNILSQNGSCEIMRRIKSRKIVTEMVKFLELENYVFYKTDALKRLST